MCPFQTKNLTQMCLWFKWFKSNLLDSNNFVANSTLSQLRSFLGALLAKIWWWGTLKHFNGLGWWWRTMGLFNFLRKNYDSQWPHERLQLVVLIFGKCWTSFQMVDTAMLLGLEQKAVVRRLCKPRRRTYRGYKKPGNKLAPIQSLSLFKPISTAFHGMHCRKGTFIAWNTRNLKDKDFRTSKALNIFRAAKFLVNNNIL